MLRRKDFSETRRFKDLRREMVFKKLFKGLAKTREKISSGLKDLFSGNRRLDDDFIEELEEVLYTSDMGSTARQ